MSIFRVKTRTEKKRTPFWRRGRQCAMAFLFATCVVVASCPTVKVWASEKSESKKTKIGKVWLVVDADVGIKADVSGDVYVTPDGGNTDRYRIDDVQLVNDGGEEFSNTNPPEFEITLVSQDEEEYYFAKTGSSAVRLDLATTAKSKYDKVELISAKRQNDNSELVIRGRLIFDKKADTRKVNSPAVSGTAGTTETTGATVIGAGTSVEAGTDRTGIDQRTDSSNSGTGSNMRRSEAGTRQSKGVPSGLRLSQQSIIRSSLSKMAERSELCARSTARIMISPIFFRAQELTSLRCAPSAVETMRRATGCCRML